MNTTTDLVSHQIPVRALVVGQRIRPNRPDSEGATVVRIIDTPSERIVDLAKVSLLREGVSAYDATDMVVTFLNRDGVLTTFLPEGVAWQTDTYHVRNGAHYTGTERRTQEG